MVAIGILAALAFLSSAQAFQVPANTTEGIYAFGFDDNGIEIYTKISEFDEPPTESARGMPAASLLPSRLARRYGSSSINAHVGITCYEDGITLDNADIMRAAMNLGQACNGVNSLGEKSGAGGLVIPKHEGRVAVYGSAQVFTCNMSKNDHWCDGEETSTLVTKVSDHCHNSGGFYNRGRPARESFGYNLVGEKFCTKNKL